MQKHRVRRNPVSKRSGLTDDIYAVAGQLKKSSGAIITMLGNYEKVLKELAGVYEDTEKTVSRNAGKLKFGGMR